MPSDDISAGRRRIEEGLIMAACVLAILLYARAQLQPSFSFLYHLARALLPGLIPDLGDNGLDWTR